MIKRYVFTAAMFFMNINGAANLPAKVASEEAKSADNDSWETQDKKGQDVLIEWQTINNFEDYSALAKQILPIHAEAFCDEIKDYLLDSSLQVRPEYAELMRNFLASDGMDELKEKFKQYVELCRAGTKQDRIASSLKSGQARLQDFWEEHQTHKLVMVLAKNKVGAVLGYALFYLSHPDFSPTTAFLQEVAMAPEAQGLGLSKHLIFSILKIAPKMGFEKNRIVLDTNIWNTKAQEVYRHLGFKEIECTWTFACLGFEYTEKYFEFPRPTGQYAVGTQLIELTDENRLESIKGDSAKFRRLPVQAWYPSSLQGSYAGTGPTEEPLSEPTSPYTYEMLKGLRQECADKFEGKILPKDLSDQFDLIRSYAVDNAKILENSTKYPVIIFAHGYGTCRGEYTAFCEELASQGYVVLTVWQTHITSITRFTDGTETEFVQDRCPEMFTYFVDDIKFMLSSVQKGAFKELTPFCDFERVGIVGHSLGGMMSSIMCRQDARIKAGFSMSGPLYGPDAMKPFHKPFAFMIEPTFFEMFADDDMLEVLTGLKRDEFPRSLDMFCETNGKNSYKLVLKNSEHRTFSDCPILANISKQIFHKELVNLDTGTLDGNKAIEIIRAYVVSFFDKYLKGQQSPLIEGKDTRYAEHVEYKSWV